jgi:hypothetical protein
MHNPFLILLAAFAIYNYWRSGKLERARWAAQLHAKFYESGKYDDVRETLDCETDSADFEDLFSTQEPSLTTYLNFFELVVFLQESKQLRRDEIDALFEYYLRCLSRHRRVREYVDNRANNYQYLSRFLGSVTKQT